MEKENISVHSTKKLVKANYYFVNERFSRQLISDVVIVEQPLQITLSWHQAAKIKSNVFAITMRTPGNEQALIIGLLISEGIINNLAEIECIDADATNNNQWIVQLSEGTVPELASLERYQMTYSSCGLCGSTSLNALELKKPLRLTQTQQKFEFPVSQISRLASEMRHQQVLFSQTGGVHGAALFDQQANLLHVFEDIGRHNAVDKVIGHYLLTQKANHKTTKSTLVKHEQVNELLILVVSGRISFEIVQKALMAGFSILVGVGAASDLAIQAAQRFDMTLIGFVSEQGFNVYHGDWRLTNHN